MGPCYEDKAGRRGIRIADLLDREYFADALRTQMEDHRKRARAFGIEEEIDVEGILAKYAAAAERIRPLVCDTAFLLADAMRDGKNLLFEGAQGTMLDLDHGTYPFVTSSSACAGGASTGTGVPPTKIDAVIGISKAYITRVGGGPFPTEALDGKGDLIRNRGKEFGSVTGRPRRCGWFDAPLLRYSATLNGFETMVVTKLDVLDELDEIPVCVAYKIDGQMTTRDAGDGPRTGEGRARLRNAPRLENFHRRYFGLEQTSRRRAGVHHVPGRSDGRGSRMHFHRT